MPNIHLANLDSSRSVYIQDSNENGVYDEGENFITVDGSRSGKNARRLSTSNEIQRAMSTYGIQEIQPGTLASDIDTIRETFNLASTFLLADRPAQAETLLNDLYAQQFSNIVFSLEYYEHPRENLTRQMIDHFCAAAQVYSLRGDTDNLRLDVANYQWLITQRPALTPKVNRYMQLARDRFIGNQLESAGSFSRRRDLRNVSRALYFILHELEFTNTAVLPSTRRRILALESSTWRAALPSQMETIRNLSEDSPLRALCLIQTLRQELASLHIPFEQNELNRIELPLFHRAVEVMFHISKTVGFGLETRLINILTLQALQESSGLALNPSENNQLRTLQENILPEALAEAREYALTNPGRASRALRAISSLQASHPELGPEYLAQEHRILGRLAEQAHEGRARGDRSMMDYSVRTAARLLHLEAGGDISGPLNTLWKEKTGLDFRESQRQSIPNEVGLWRLSNLMEAVGRHSSEETDMMSRVHYLLLRSRNIR